MQKLSTHNFFRAMMLPLEQIDKDLPQSGKIFDLGCGEGTIAIYLAATSTRQVVGVDADVKRLPSTNGKNLKFEKGDITKYKLNNADGVVISDVLHHINFNGQAKVLKNVAQNLKKGGVLIIKEIDSQEFIRSKLSRFWDFVFYPKDKIYYNSAKVLKEKLESLGFRVTIKRPTRLFPGSTTLYICKK